ncbi:hypothetical protein IQ07DRAFT_597939 [Pyrenochaeta sp. DS3sAY3a]|nr:hypothetical protein IQ07DRAFT_597939 [Pyrenochaeta sp. DS3sAY3a]
MKSLRRDALQAQSLRTQAQVSKDRMQALQLEMLSRVEKVRTTPDDQLAQDFRTIKAMVRSLSRSIQIAPDVDVLAVLHSYDLASSISEHEWSTRGGRKRTVEAVIWSILAGQLFDHPFSILGTSGPLTNHVWRNVFGEMHCGSWPVPTAQCERWRYMTMDSAIKATGKVSMEDSNAKETPQHQTMAKVPVHVSEAIRSNLFMFAPAEDFASVATIVSTIVDKAIGLAREMALQRCRLQVTFPLDGEVYNPDCMETLSDPDGDDVEEGTVAYAINPGLTKWGDAHGENLDQRLDVVPALVQLEPKGMMGVKLEPQD